MKSNTGKCMTLLILLMTLLIFPARNLYADEAVSDRADSIRTTGAYALRSRGMTLEQADKSLYDYLKGQVTKIADGQMASSEIRVPLTEIYGSEVTKSFTAADLGVESIVVNNAINPGAKDALYHRFSLDFQKVLSCLLADCPYDLYWYDKTAGISYTSPKVTASGQGDSF